MKNKLFNKICITAALVLLMAGCAATGTKKDNTADIEKRAIQRWEYLIARQGEKAYDYLTPGFRATKSREIYASEMNNRPMNWKSVRFSKKECTEDRCEVFLSVDYFVMLNAGMRGPMKGFAPLKETWVRVKGKWYYLPSR